MVPGRCWLWMRPRAPRVSVTIYTAVSAEPSVPSVVLLLFPAKASTAAAERTGHENSAVSLHNIIMVNIVFKKKVRKILDKKDLKENA